MNEHRPESEPTIRGATRLTSWAMLLSHWTSFARNSVALPNTSEGNAWKASIAPCIGLQAHVFALASLGELPAEERPVGLDRASVGIREHEAVLDEAWAGEPMPGSIADLIIDARDALKRARAAHAPQDGD